MRNGIHPNFEVAYACFIGTHSLCVLYMEDVPCALLILRLIHKGPCALNIKLFSFSHQYPYKNCLDVCTLGSSATSCRCVRSMV